MSPPLEYERLLLALHDAMKSDSEAAEVEADQIRDEMDYWCRKLTPSEQKLMSKLSGDLYLLDAPPPPDPEEASKVLQRIRELHYQWSSIGFALSGKRFGQYVKDHTP